MRCFKYIVCGVLLYDIDKRHSGEGEKENERKKTFPFYKKISIDRKRSVIVLVSSWLFLSSVTEIREIMLIEAIMIEILKIKKSFFLTEMK